MGDNDLMFCGLIIFRLINLMLCGNWKAGVDVLWEEVARRVRTWNLIQLPGATKKKTTQGATRHCELLSQLPPKKFHTPPKSHNIKNCYL